MKKGGISHFRQETPEGGGPTRFLPFGNSKKTAGNICHTRILFRQSEDKVGLFGGFGQEVGSGGVFVVGDVEARGHGGTEESEFSAGVEETPLPDVFSDDDLELFVGEDIFAHGDDLSMTVGVKLEHGYRIAEVEMENFVGAETVHGGAGLRGQQIVDGGAEGTFSRVAVWKTGFAEQFGRAIGFGVETALVGMGFEFEPLDNIVRG